MMTPSNVSCVTFETRNQVIAEVKISERLDEENQINIVILYPPVYRLKYTDDHQQLTHCLIETIVCR